MRDTEARTRPIFFLRSSRSRVDLLSYDSKSTDRREQYDWMDEKKNGRARKKDQLRQRKTLPLCYCPFYSSLTGHVSCCCRFFALVFSLSVTQSRSLTFPWKKELFFLSSRSDGRLLFVRSAARSLACYLNILLFLTRWSLTVLLFPWNRVREEEPPPPPPPQQQQQIESSSYTAPSIA